MTAKNTTSRLLLTPVDLVEKGQGSKMTCKPWQELDPELFEDEKEALKQLGFELDQKELKEKNVVFNGTINVEGEEIPLHITYPSGFPLIPPSASCDRIFYREHQTLHGGDLCLIHGPDYAGHFVSGRYIVDRAKILLNHYLKGIPIPETPEPQSMQYHFTGTAMILTPPFMRGIEKHDSGYCKIFFNESFTHGVLTNLRGGKTGETKLPINKQYKHLPLIMGASIPVYALWVSVDELPPLFSSIDDFKKWLQKINFKDVNFSHAQISAEHVKTHGLIAGIYYPDGDKEYWLFISFNSRLTPDRRVVYYHSQYLIPNNMFRRVKDLDHLRGKKVAVVGLGAIGSVVALELAKAGLGNIHLIDFDVVNAGNLVRHIADLRDIGTHKVNAVAKQIAIRLPNINITPHLIKVGSGPYKELEEFFRVVEDVDLVIDATADPNTTTLINKIIVKKGKPLVCAYSAAGVLAGRIYRVIPRETACSECLGYYFEEGSFDPVPEDAFVVAENEHGCNIPSVPGAGFDTTSIAIFATRLSVQTLLRETESRYQNSDFDQLLWTNREITSLNINSFYKKKQNLKPHPSCTTCN